MSVLRLSKVLEIFAWMHCSTRLNCEIFCIVPYFAEDRKDLEISKSSILKKKKRKWRTKIGPERTWTGNPWLKKLWSIHLSYLQLDDQKREKSTKVLTHSVQTQWSATSLYSFCLSSQKRSLFGDVFANIVENMLSTIVPSFSVSMANRTSNSGTIYTYRKIKLDCASVCSDARSRG